MQASLLYSNPSSSRDAYAYCLQLARAHYENFPVASRLVPAALRPDVAAIYAFARVADDMADEGTAPPDVRCQRLDRWRDWLRACARGERAEGAGGHALIFDALGETIARHALPVQPFEDLVSAFRQDVVVSRYETWEDVLDYCRRSANPVGRLVLRLAGYDAPDLGRASDDVCTALQLTNFWQDLAIDWKRGRLYVPREELRAWGAHEAQLDRQALSPSWQQVMASAAARTRGLFDAGATVCDGVRGRLALELRLTWLGGMRVLERLEAVAFDVFDRRPRLGVRDALPVAWRALTWRRRRSPVDVARGGGRRIS